MRRALVGVLAVAVLAVLLLGCILEDPAVEKAKMEWQQTVCARQRAGLPTSTPAPRDRR